jgi:hypothetical protein
MTVRSSSAQRKKRDDGVRWHVIRADLKNFFGRLPQMFRNDPTAVMLVVANIYPVITLVVKGEPIGSLLVVYWIQLMIIGFWNAVKLSLDVFGHFAEHGMLSFDEDPRKPLWREP